MAVNIGTLQAFIVADNSGLLKATRQSVQAMDKAAKSAAEMSSKVAASFDRVGKSLTLGVTLPIAAAGAAMAKSAIDAEETANKFSVVFSSVRTEANAMAEALRSDFGLARTESRQLLSDTADLLSGFGFTQDAALDLSNQVNMLAVDLASFTNVEGGAQRASAALTKALLGERESAKELGIAILEADVKAKVLQLRQQGLTFDTDRQAKAYATLQIALEQSKNAIGDFERSEKSTANQLRIFTARLKDGAELLGTAFLPKINAAAGAGIRMLEAFSMLNPEIQSLAVQVALVAAAAGPAAIVMSKLATVVSVGFSAFSGVLTVVAALASPLGILTLGLGAAVAAFINLVGPVDALAIGWQALEEAWVFWVQQFNKGVTFLVTKAEELGALALAADLIGKAWVALRVTFSLVLSGIGTMIGKTAKGIAKLALSLEKAAGFLGVKLGTEGREALEALSLTALEFGDVNAMVAADTAAEWDTAFEHLKATGATFTAATREAFTTLAAAGSEALEILRSNASDKAAQIEALFQRVRDSVVNIGAQISGVQVTPGGVALPGEEGETPEEEDPTPVPGLGGEALQEWFDNNAATLQNFRDLAADTFTSFADGFSDAVADVIVSGKSFKSAITGLLKSAASAIISELIKMSIVTVAMGQTRTAANSAAAAPHPLLIPAFVGLGLAAFAAAIGSTDGGSSVGGGSAPAAIAAPAEPTGPAQSTVVNSVDTSITEGEGNASAARVIRVEIDDNARGNLMSLIVDETRNGAGDGSGQTLALEAT